ncbi:MAG TPA: efflux RND transporter periplasmic adaptor subunit [Candidatus Binataceae bacterium]|nr:efflux RND transporter periplasmic adaptor subunit [Candidatus Binataceae bacterium]
MKTATAGLLAMLLASFVASAAAGQAQLEGSVVKLVSGSDAAGQIVLTSIDRKQITGEISATATIEADAGAVAHITSRIPARVVKLVADLGQQVTPGQTLVILSSEELGQAKAEYLKTRSLLAISEENLRREQELFGKKIAPMKDVLEARAVHDTALAQFKSSRENLRLLIPARELDSLGWTEKGGALSEFPLASPIAGTLVKRQLAIGTMIDRNDDPLVVIDLDKVWVMAAVFEHDLAGLHEGEDAAIKVDAYPDQTFRGKVTYVGNEIDRANRTVQARIEVPNPQHLLKPGMFAHAAIAVSEARRVLVAPESAVFDVGEEKVVFVASGAGQYVAHDVQLGTSAGGVVEILSGVHENDRVVSRGGLVLKALLTKGTAG